MFEDYDPGLGITRIRYNGYNLSLKVRHPSKISAQRYEKKRETPLRKEVCAEKRTNRKNFRNGARM